MDWTLASVRIAGVYLLFGFGWILFSDRLLEWFAQSPDELARWQTYKGWVFVALTASLLHWLVHGQVAQIAKSREELRQSEARYRILFEKNPWPMFIYETSTLRLVATNEAAIQQYGYSRDEFLSMALLDLFPEDQRGRLLDIAEERNRNIAATVIALHRRKQGDSLEVEINAQPIYWHGRNCVLVLAVDLTERRSLEAQLQQAQKMEAIGLLAGGVAHDFNNMLGVILGYAEMLQSLEKDEDRKVFLKEITDAAGKAAAVTRQLLAFSRKQVLDLHSVDLNQLVRENQKLLQKLLGEQIEIHAELAANLWKTRADPNQMVQVLMNLAVNARDAMAASGRLTIQTENRVFTEHDLAVRSFLKLGAYVCLVVRDTGHGMDEATQRRIFEPFFTTKEVGRGTGLGLSTVYGIVKHTGGFIWVESAPGAGAKFIVALPSHSEEAVAHARTASDASSAGHGEKILLVEDEDAMRRLVSAVLREAGYDVLEAAGGEEALTLLETNGRIDLLLTDVVMPRMSGVEVSKRVREKYQTLPVLFVSGYANDYVAGLTPLDSSVFLLKPFRREVLLARVRGALDARLEGSAIPGVLES